MPIETRREQVLDAALRLIATRGYEAVTMEGIAQEAGLAKPVVYNAYPRLRPLLHALLEREERRALATLSRGVGRRPPDDEGEDPLLAWLRRIGDAMVERPTTWRLILIPPAGTPEIVREHVEAGRAFALEQIRTLMAALLARRGLPQPVDADLTARAILASAEALGRLLLDRPDEYPPERLVAFARATLEALRT
jgi:AcrR family transcriptional regulator